MSDEKNAEVDPRFDPAFQRGFDPAIPVEEYLPEPLPRRIAAPAIAPAPLVAAPAPAAARPEAAVAPVAAVVAADADGESDDEPVVAVDTDASPSRNPFLLFLGIIAIALVVAGVWLFIRSGDAFNSKEVRSQGDYMSLDATIHSAPFIALLGAATAIGVLFFFASKWRRRR
jgi:hypothetical protein